MAFTKVTGPGIHTQANILSHNINSSGIITATKFSGPLVGNTNNASGISTFYDLRVSNNLTVEGATTTLDTNLVGVDRVEVGANSNTVVGVAITQSGTADILRLYDGSTQVVTVLDTGEVGIGTATPGAEFEVRGAGTVAHFKGTGGNCFIGLTDVDAAAGVGYIGSDGGDLLFQTPGSSYSTKLQIHSNGAISAGVDNDSYELTLQGMSGGAPTLWLRDGTTSGSPRILFGDTGAATRSAIYHKNSNDSLNFYTNGEVSAGDERLTINSSGLVGIGSDTLTSQLEIKRANVSGTYPNGNAKPSGASIWNDGGDTFTGRLFLQGTALSASSDFLTGINNEGNVLVVYNYGSSKYMQKWHKNAQVELMYNGNTRLNTTTQGAKIGGHADTVLLVEGTSTASRIDLKTSSHHRFWQTLESDGRFRFYDQTNAAERFTISSAGKVGIATNNPQQMLDVRGNVVIGIDQVSGNPGNTTGITTIRGHFVNAEGDFARLSFSNSLSASGASTRSTASIRGLRLGDNLGTGLAFWTNPTSGANPGVERLRIDQTGTTRLQRSTYDTGAVTVSNAALYLDIGSTEGAVNMNQLIGFGYRNALTNAKPAYIGYQATTWSGHTRGDLIFGTRDTTTATDEATERLRITSNGHALLGGTATVDDLTGGAGQKGLVIGSTGMGNAGIAIINSTTGAGRIYFGDNTGAHADRKRGQICYYHNDGSTSDYMAFVTAAEERLRIASDGKATFTSDIATAQDYPDFRPTLDFNFASVKKLDSRFTYTRIGPASYIDEFGKVVLVGANTPRFDHDPATGESKGLLIEDNRTNLIPNSFDKGTWSAGSGGSTVTRNAGTAPDGTETATKILSANNDIDVNPQLGNASAGATGQISISGSTTYTLSVWVKASTTSQVGNNFKVRWKRVQGDSTFAENAFTLPANWTRYTATATTAANNSTIACYVGGVANSEALVWGAQFEAGSFATSLIPTYGAAVTREADFVGITGDEHTDFWNTTEGTYLIDYKPLELAVGDGVIIGSKRGSNGSGYPWPLYRHDTANTNNFKSYDLTNGIIEMSTTWADRRESWALGFNGTNGSIVRNGSQLATNNTNMNGLIDANELWLGSSSTGSVYSMHVRRFMYYAKRITDSQLITLTS